MSQVEVMNLKKDLDELAKSLLEVYNRLKECENTVICCFKRINNLQELLERT